MRATIRRSSILGATATAMLVLALTTTPSSATTPAASPRVTIDSAPTWTKQAKAIAPTPSTQSQSMTAVLKMRDQAGAEALALAVSDPSNAKYGTHLSAAAFRSRFAPTDARSLPLSVGSRRRASPSDRFRLTTGTSHSRAAARRRTRRSLRTSRCSARTVCTSRPRPPVSWCPRRWPAALPGSAVWICPPARRRTTSEPRKPVPPVRP